MIRLGRCRFGNAICVWSGEGFHVRFTPQLLERFNRRKRTVTGKWHLDETYIKVRGQWMYLYRAIDSVGDAVEFLFSEHRDLVAAKRFLRKAIARHGRPE